MGTAALAVRCPRCIGPRAFCLDVS
jgi:hypothetical protein